MDRMNKLLFLQDFHVGQKVQLRPDFNSKTQYAYRYRDTVLYSYYSECREQAAGRIGIIIEKHANPNSGLYRTTMEGMKNVWIAESALLRVRGEFNHLLNKGRENKENEI